MKIKVVHLFIDSVNQIELTNYYIKKGNGFKIENTGKSIKYVDLIDGEAYILSEERIGFPLMSLIKRTKDDVRKNIKNKIIIEKNPQFYKINQKRFDVQGGYYNYCTELDITKAYLNAAYLEGFLSKKIYQEILFVNGINRKRVIGSLATRKIISTYDKKGELLNKETVLDIELRKVWSNICAFVGEKMNQIIELNNENNFLFFWVDNIFFSMEKKYILFPAELEVKLIDNSINYIVENNNIKILTADGRQFSLPNYRG